MFKESDLSAFLQSNPNAVIVNDITDKSLQADFELCLKEADVLCDNIDPEDTPYKSKYNARDKLDVMCNKLEATKTIATVENNKKIVEDMESKLASCRVRLATIAWDCDEPHNTERELELASNYYFPTLYNQVISRTTKYVTDSSDILGTDDLKEDVSTVEAEVPTLPLVFGKKQIPFETLVTNILKCLNLSGILWAGRGHVKRSFMFLYSSYNIYQAYCVPPDIPSTQKLENQQSDVGQGLPLHVQNDVEALHTLTLFYLAQAYGHLRDSTKSSRFCHQTLQRQLISGSLVDSNLSAEWIKNCLGMTDFYNSSELYYEAICSILSAEKVFERYCPQSVVKDARSIQHQYVDKFELYGLFLKKYISYDVQILKLAFERELERIDSPTKWTPAVETQSQGADSKRTETTSDSTAEYFSGLPITIPNYTHPDQIIQFADARIVYLRAVQKLALAKDIFPLNGFVTTYTELSLQHSKLYHYLAIFENDLKRKFSMENKRTDLLLPILTTISSAAYEALHKQLSYELGETFLNIFDAKMDLTRQKMPNNELTITSIKPLDANKCNEYCRLGLAMFTYFTSFYKKKESLSNNMPITRLLSATVDDINNEACWDPDESSISLDELRPFFNGHFLSARFLTKIIILPSQETTNAEKAKFAIASLQRYEWLLKNCISICERKQVNYQHYFDLEFNVCRDMVELMPSKINRIHYLGYDSLIL